MRTGFIIALALAVAACGSVADNVAEQATEEVLEQAAESGGEGEAEIDVSEDEITITEEGEDGSQSAEFGTDVEPPDDLPVPIPDGILWGSAIRNDLDDRVEFGLSGTFDPERFDEIVAFYDDHYGDEAERTVNEAEGTRSVTWFADGFFVLVNLVDDQASIGISGEVQQ